MFALKDELYNASEITSTEIHTRIIFVWWIIFHFLATMTSYFELQIIYLFEAEILAFFSTSLCTYYAYPSGDVIV